MTMQPREALGVERRHREYSRFWSKSPWTSEVTPAENVVWVYEIAISHRTRRRKFVVYVGCASTVNTIQSKRETMTPKDCVSFVRAVEIRAEDRASGVRKAAVLVGMCKSDFDYACVDGKRALVVPTCFGAKLQRIGYRFIASSGGGTAGIG